MSNISCPLCFSETHKLLHADNAICRECGFVFQQQRHPREYYHTLPCHFPPDYAEHALRRGKYITDFLPQETLSSIHRFLDIGCGKGAVINAIEGLLPNTIGWGCTLGTSGTNIVQGDIETIDFPHKNFNFIVLCHTLEHFLSPVQTLIKVSQLLEPNGVIYIEVPSFDWVELRLPSVWTPEHMSYFTPTTLTNALLMAGLTPIKLKESKYWGNIKVVCVKNASRSIDIKKVDYHYILWYHKLVKLSYPWYRLMQKVRTIGPND